jgi:GntR family transcriptional repressor for pyruvate dehydrogenase complex
MSKENEPLEKMERSRLSDRVADQLRKQVALGGFAPGERLPATKDLADQLGVTRLTVREALAQLEAAGLVESRHGSGTFVVDLRGRATLQQLATFIGAGRVLGNDELRDLLVFRAVVLNGFLDTIVARIDYARCSALDGIVAEERKVLGQPEKLAALDYRFNEILAEVSGNLFYQLLLRSLREAHLNLGSIVFSQAGDGSVVVDTHHAIVRALSRRDPGALRRRMQRYLDGARRLVTQSF